MSTHSRLRIAALVALMLAVALGCGVWLRMESANVQRAVPAVERPHRAATLSARSVPSSPLVAGRGVHPAPPRVVTDEVLGRAVVASPQETATPTAGTAGVDVRRSSAAEPVVEAAVLPEPVVADRALTAPTQVEPAEAEPTPVGPAEVEPASVEASTTPVILEDQAMRGQRVLRELGFDPATVGYTISFEDARTSVRGLTFTQDRRIEIYVRPSMSDTDLAYVIAHELGHAVDHMRNSAEDRAQWRVARGMAVDSAWWPGSGANDMATPAGDFAECFAAWLVGSASHSTWGGCPAGNGLMAELALS